MGSKKTSKTPASMESTAKVGGDVWQSLKLFARTYKTTIMLVSLGFLAGFLWLTSVRFFTLHSPETHYHANFSVYINGVREEFDIGTYYEEVAACTSSYQGNPKGRVHMHDTINDIIHVHDARVTYGHFFQNIGWAVGDEYLVTLENLYQTEGTKKVRYFINNEEVDSVTNRVIGNLDKLLVTYGEKNEDVTAQLANIGNSAEEKNKYQDPSSCGGLNGAGFDSFGSRLKRATFWQ